MHVGQGFSPADTAALKGCPHPSWAVLDKGPAPAIALAPHVRQRALCLGASTGASIGASIGPASGSGVPSTLEEPLPVLFPHPGSGGLRGSSCAARHSGRQPCVWS